MINIYRASAGSGKTYTLTKEYIQLLFASYLDGNKLPHRRIMAVTFTNKATEEMKSRIIKELNALATDAKSDYRANLMEEFKLSATEVNQQAKTIMINILHDYSGFNISTIDKFFQKVVRAFAREVGMNGGYNVELERDYILQQALDNLYLSLSEKENETLIEWLAQFMEEKIDDGKSWVIKHEIIKLGDEIFKEGFQQKATQARDKIYDKDFLKHYRKNLMLIKAQFESKVKEETDIIDSLLDRFLLTPDHFKKGFTTQFYSIKNEKNYDLDKLKKISEFAENVDKCYTSKAEESTKESIRAAYVSGLGDAFNRLVTIMTSEELSHYNSAVLIQQNLNTLGILADLSEHIKMLSKEQNFLLISDTNMLLNKIIDGSDAPFVYERIGERIRHFMIDEFQDTSILQWQNFKPLISNSLAENNFNMLVGDVKQSIYRWRNSDWKILNEQVNKDFNKEQINHKNLDINWRSDAEIIHFNNLFFEKSSHIIQDKFNSESESLITSNDKQFDGIDTKIMHAYEDTIQKLSPKAGQGYVKIDFIEENVNKEEINNEIFNRLPKLIEELVDRGYKPSDIGFLVRSRKEATFITEKMLAYRQSDEARHDLTYELVGSDGLRISLSRSINFIISLLRLVINPNDEISRVNIHQEYLVSKKKQSEEEAIRNSFLENENDNSAQSPLFTEDENRFIEHITRMSIFSAVEKMIEVFDLKSWYNEAVFLQAFQDVVFKFSSKQNNDIQSFLNYWEEQSHKFRIVIPENENASTIMTIHAAKGLEFKVVIIPFATWEFKPRHLHQPLLWCQTDVEPFNKLPLMPIKSGSKLINSIFKEDYLLELLHQYVDNLNLAYVAFTRANSEMYCFATKPSKSKINKGMIEVSTISDLLYKVINESTEWAENWDANNNLFELGVATTHIRKSDEKKTSIASQSIYPIVDSTKRLRLKDLRPKTLNNEDVSFMDMKYYGILMHEILKQIKTPEDEDRILKSMLFAGKINQEQHQQIQTNLTQFWANKQVASWFDGEGEVLNETTILQPLAKQYRPDRVILKKNRATIVDYKFGEEHHKTHIRQLQNYADLLKKMGYEVEAFLYYVAIDKVVNLH